MNVSLELLEASFLSAIEHSINAEDISHSKPPPLDIEMSSIRLNLNAHDFATKVESLHFFSNCRSIDREST